MYFVYLLRSLSDHSKRYTGITDNLERRLKAHNAGRSAYTAPYTPWKIEAFIAVESKEHAGKLERYLKSGSGTIFANRHLWSDQKTTERQEPS